MINRRNFLKTSGAITAGLALGGLSAAYSEEQRLKSIGLQLYTLRSLMEKNVATTLQSVGEIGYKEVEFAGYFNHSPKEIVKMLEDNGLSAPSVHAKVDVFENDFDGFLEAAHTIGHKYIVLPWLPEKDRNVERYKAIADILNAAGEKAKAAGMQVAYHNHDFEFFKIDGVELYDLLLTRTDVDLVQFQLDIFWTVLANRDPLTYFERYPGRFPSVHVKDRDAAGNMTEVGAGIIDFKRLFQQAEKAGLKHYFIEHDNPTAPLQSATQSFHNLSGLKF